MVGKKEPPKALSKEFISDSSDEDSASNVESSTETNLPGENNKAKSVSVDKVVGSVSAVSSGRNSSGSKSTPEASSKPSRTSEKKQKTHEPTQKPAQKQSAPVVTSIPAEPFKAPKGFSRVTATSPAGTSGGRQLLSNLNGKQVWHITVPASLPASSIKELDFAALEKGKSIVNHQGREYGISRVREQSDDDYTIIQSSDDGGKYEPLHLRFNQAYQVYELPQSTGTGIGSADFPAIPAVSTSPGKYAKPIRQQPEGLRMKYQPFGTEETFVGAMGEPNNLEFETTAFRMPRQLPSPPAEPAKKKRKKHDKQAAAEAEPDAMDLDTLQVQESSHAKGQSESQVSATSVQSSPSQLKDKKDKKKKKKREASHET